MFLFQLVVFMRVLDIYRKLSPCCTTINFVIVFCVVPCIDVNMVVKIVIQVVTSYDSTIFNSISDLRSLGKCDSGGWRRIDVANCNSHGSGESRDVSNCLSQQFSQRHL